MENEPIKNKILADYKTLLGLKHDSSDLIKDKLKLIGEHINQLGRSPSAGKDVFRDAAHLINLALTTEFMALSEASTEEDKEEALAQLKHKVAEACQLLQIHG